MASELRRRVRRAQERFDNAESHEARQEAAVVLANCHEDLEAYAQELRSGSCAPGGAPGASSPAGGAPGASSPAPGGASSIDVLEESVELATADIARMSMDVTRWSQQVEQLEKVAKDNAVELGHLRSSMSALESKLAKLEGKLAETCAGKLETRAEVSALVGKLAELEDKVAEMSATRAKVWALEGQLAELSELMDERRDGKFAEMLEDTRVKFAEMLEDTRVQVSQLERRQDHLQRHYNEYAMTNMSQHQVFLDALMEMQRSFQLAITCIQEKTGQ